MNGKAEEVIAQTLVGAGVRVITYTPTFGGNGIFAEIGRIRGKALPVSFNEETAYAIAHGAALAGVRAATLIKSHGLAKAGNAVIDSLTAGVIAGFIPIVIDDRQGIQSDNIFDICAFLKGIGIPFRVADVTNIPGEILASFEASERLQLPHAVLVEATDMEKSVPVSSRRLPDCGRGYKREITEHILCPFFCDYQLRVLQAKRAGLDWQGIAKPAIPRIPEALPEKWKPLAAAYSPLFTLFRDCRGDLVTGETGVSTLFAFPPFQAVDITTFMGGSLPLAVGASLAGFRNVWAVTGDFSFIAAGHLGLPEVLQRGIPLKVLILDNGRAETTGGQLIPDGTLEGILGGYDRYVRRIRDPQSVDETESVLREASAADELRIVVADYRTTGEPPAQIFTRASYRSGR
jgi:TPP-dependent indolepyruvate ferredoxin oxidoreductase alpha subunit